VNKKYGGIKRTHEKFDKCIYKKLRG